MNKGELVEQISNQTGLTKRTSREAVDAVTSVISDALTREEKVTLVGFGTFQVMERKARRGVNPQTRETLRIPAKKVPKFVPGKSLREAVG
jgi:DNA-binding protein HU-beta